MSFGRMGLMGRGFGRMGFVGGGGAAPFSISDLFANGEVGWCFIPASPYAALYQERTGASATTPAGNGNPVGTLHDLVTGKYFTASADDRRPIVTVASSKTHLEYDGTDDCSVGPTVDLSGTDKVTLFAAFNAAINADQVIVEFGSNSNTVDGSFGVLTDTSERFTWALRGTVLTAYRTTDSFVPVQAVTSCVLDLAGASRATEVFPRLNGIIPTLTALGGTSAGTGNFGNLIPYIGARADASVRLDGSIWGVIVVGRACTADEIAATELILSGLSGITW